MSKVNLKPKRLKDKLDGILNFSDYKKTRHKVTYIIFMVLLVVIALIALVPILWLFITSFKSVNEINSIHYHLFPEEFNLMKIAEVWRKTQFGRYYLNTLIVVAGSVFCAVVFNSLIAYAIGVLKPVGHKIINTLILLGYMIPSILSAYALVAEIKTLGLINSYLPLWLMMGANAYYYLLLKDSFQKIPKSLIEAAKMDGLNDFEILFKIVLPLSKSIIGVVAIFAMTASYSDFLLPYLLLTNPRGTVNQTVMVAIYNLSGTDTLDASEKLMLLVISIIPQIIIFAAFQKQIMNQGTNAGIKE